VLDDGGGRIESRGAWQVPGRTHRGDLPCHFLFDCRSPHLWLDASFMRGLSWMSHRGPTLLPDAVMATFWKVLIGLAIALPMAAYVAGSFIASSADDPVRRDPVYISDVRETPEADKKPGGKDPSAPPSRRTPVNGDDDDDDDDGVRVVTPKPTRVDGDDGPEGDDDDSRDGGDDSDDGEGD
jgi:hypothetical protein